MLIRNYIFTHFLAPKDVPYLSGGKLSRETSGEFMEKISEKTTEPDSVALTTAAAATAAVADSLSSANKSITK